MAAEQLGEIVIAPRVWKNHCHCNGKGRRCLFLRKIRVCQTVFLCALSVAEYRFIPMRQVMTVDIYLYLEYGVSVPTVAVAIQKAVKVLFLTWLR